MIKAVFFDLYQTLICYNPPREEKQAEVLKECGIEIEAARLAHPIVTADEFIHQEHARQSLNRRSDQEKMAIWGRYQQIVLTEAGIKPSQELIGHILKRMQQIKFQQVLFDDVVPALTHLKDKGYSVGLISNVDSDISQLLAKVGLTPLLDVVVTSMEAGYCKPQPQIFQAAAARAGVKTEEAAYIGDQYRIDVLGAKEAGMLGILLDRGGYFDEQIKEPRISSLSQLDGHLY
jgi:putative hydrolase of the HAD superfamily